MADLPVLAAQPDVCLVMHRQPCFPTWYAEFDKKSLAGYLSEQGLQQTKDAFTKESPDLLGTDTDNDMDKGQKLSLIIEEYFLLKKIGKCIVITSKINLHLISLYFMQHHSV